MVYQVTANMSDFSEDELLQDLLDSQEDLLICWLSLEIGATELDTSAPKPDIAICSRCGWKGSPNDCGKITDQSHRLFLSDTCPACVTTYNEEVESIHGGIILYDMSPEREAEYETWRVSRSKSGIQERMETNEIIAQAIELEFKIRRMIVHQYDQESKEFKKVEAKSLIQNISIDKK